MSRPWEIPGTREIGNVEREALARLGDHLIPQQAAPPLTWADINHTMDRLLEDLPPARTLHCGWAAWEILRSNADKTTNVLGGITAVDLYGMPVRVDDEMPGGAWEIREGDRRVIGGDFAPGLRCVAFVPGVGLVGFPEDADGAP